MIRSYFTIAIRNIRKHRLYSAINVFGLSTGIAFCVLIYLYIRDERSFDQFHERKNDIYRLHASSFDKEEFDKGSKDPYNSYAYLPAKLAEVMQSELAEVEATTRYRPNEEGIMRYGEKTFNQSITYVDSGFFRMFSFPIVSGSVREVFRNPTDAVITPAVVEKYFGVEDPIGKTFTWGTTDTQTFTVVAVIAAPPANSSVSYEVLLPMEASANFARSREMWGNHSYPTFVMVHPGTDRTQFKAHIDALTDKYMADRFKERRERQQIPAKYKVLEFNVVPLPEVHLYNAISWEKVSDAKYSVILGGIAVTILLIACINYIALSLTTSVSRRVEVGIRKVIGAARKQLVIQFGAESLLLGFLSACFGLLLSVLFLPAFNSFTDKRIAVPWSQMPLLVSVTILIGIVSGLLAGSYPSVFLSRFLPASVLKGRFTSRLQAGFTKPLVVLQFALSAFLIISSVIMYKQMEYVSSKDLGYRDDLVVAVETQAGWSSEADKTVEHLANALRNDAAVAGVAGVSSSFNKGWSRYGYRIEGVERSAYTYTVNADYIPLLGIELKAGRNFDGRPSDSTAIIVNEALVHDMGWTDPLSEHLNWKEDSTSLGAQVIGVVKDYHFLSLEKNIEPMFMGLGKSSLGGHLVTILVKLNPGDVSKNLARVKQVWAELYPDRPFQYSFVDDDVAKQYEQYQRWTTIAGLATIFALLIASLGLFGLAGINAVNRTKEIGIRKVMGAEVLSIFILLNRQYVWLSLAAFILAAPFSWYAMNTWLQSFQFHVSISWELFAFSLLGGLLIALATVSYHALRVASSNPAETLKHE